MKNYSDLPTIANVGAGNSVSLTLPTGQVYEKVFLYYTGATPEQLKNIRLKLNTKLVSEWADGSVLDYLQAHYKRTAVSGCLVFDFTRPEMHNLRQRRFFGLDTSRPQGITSAAIELDIDAGATAPTLKAVCEKSAPLEGQPNYLTKIRRYVIPVTAAGEFDIDRLPTPEGHYLAAIHLRKADITQADLQINNVSWHKVTKAQAANFQSIYGRDPQTADATVLDFTLDGDMMQSVPLNKSIQDFRVRYTAGSGGQIEVVLEYIGMWSLGGF